MDTIDLPVLDSSASPEQALAEMRRSQRSAVVRQTGSSHDLLMAADIFRALQQELASLSDILPSETLHTPSAPERFEGGPGRILADVDLEIEEDSGALPGVSPRSWRERDFGALLDDAGQLSYVLLGSTGLSADLLTRNESLARDLRQGPALCYCTYCGRPAPGSQTAAQCLRCGQNTVYCRTDG